MKFLVILVAIYTTVAKAGPLLPDDKDDLTWIKRQGLTRRADDPTLAQWKGLGRRADDVQLRLPLTRLKNLNDERFTTAMAVTANIGPPGSQQPGFNFMFDTGSEHTYVFDSDRQRMVDSDRLVDGSCLT